MATNTTTIPPYPGSSTATSDAPNTMSPASDSSLDPEFGSGSLSSSGSSGMSGMGGGAGGRNANDLMERVVQGAHRTIDRLAETAAPHLRGLQDGWSQAGDSLHERSDRVREMSDEWADSLRSTVRENPIAAISVALAVGVLVARLTR